MEQMEIVRTPTALADVTLFQLRGPFTLSTMFAFQSALREPDLKGCIVDLTEVPYMDSAGLGVQLGHFAHSQRHGVKFAIAGVSSRIRTIFEITHTDQVLPIYPTPQDAENTFAKAANS